MHSKACLKNVWILVLTNHKSRWKKKIIVEIKANSLSGFNELSSVEIDFVDYSFFRALK